MAAETDARPGRPTELLLSRLARPYDPARAVVALTGVSLRVARQIVGLAVATSVEAEALLDAMPQIVRSLAIATTDRPERCYGELRGPVMWSETMSARSASAGDPGLFVCATTTKAYDTVENRVLKAALAAVERAGSDATTATPTADEALSEDVRRARHNGLRARHLLEHRTLSGVPVTRVTSRALQRTRSGSRRSTYGPAIRLVQAAAAPIEAIHLRRWLDDDERARHALLAEALLQQDAAGHRHPIRTSHGTLVAGDLRYTPGEGVTVAGGAVRDLLMGSRPATDRL